MKLLRRDASGTVVGSTNIVVAFRMPLSATSPEVSYLARARALCTGAEALGARLIGWSATLLALAWDADGVREAVQVASGLRDERRPPEESWACGIAQGALEALSPEGLRMHLAWGEPLLVAASLARIARPGEVLIDGDVAAVRSGGLTLTGSRSASDGGRRVRGWQLDLDHPWRATRSDAAEPGDDRVDPWLEELASADVLELIEGGQVEKRPRSGREDPDIGRLERERRSVEGGVPAERCRASIALALGLVEVGRPEDALIETLDALARAREGKDPKALAACYALLAKLYVGVGRVDAAGELRALASMAAAVHP
jgi:hypothetical protein